MRTKSKRRICTFKGFSLRLQIRLFNIYFVSAPLRKTRKAELKSVPVRTHLYFCQTSEKTQNIRQEGIWVSFRECGAPVCGCGVGHGSCMQERACGRPLSWLGANVCISSPWGCYSTSFLPVHLRLRHRPMTMRPRMHSSVAVPAKIPATPKPAATPRV